MYLREHMECSPTGLRKPFVTGCRGRHPLRVCRLTECLSAFAGELVAPTGLRKSFTTAADAKQLPQTVFKS